MNLHLLICIDEGHKVVGKPLLFTDREAAAQAMKADYYATADSTREKQLEPVIAHDGNWDWATVAYGIGEAKSFNWSLSVVEMPVEMNAGTKLTLAKELVTSIPKSGYWPFRSPAPCSTECRIKDAVNYAKNALVDAVEAHESLYGNNPKAGNEIPCTVVSNVK